MPQAPTQPFAARTALWRAGQVPVPRSPAEATQKRADYLASSTDLAREDLTIEFEKIGERGLTLPAKSSYFGFRQWDVTHS